MALGSVTRSVRAAVRTWLWVLGFARAAAAQWAASPQAAQHSGRVERAGAPFVTGVRW